jgi:hypothetical protein
MAADIIDAVRVRGGGVRLADGTRVYSISYADDLVLISETASGLQRMLDAAHRHSRRDRFDFEPSKSEVVVFHGRSDPGAAPGAVGGAVFRLGRTARKQVDGFLYLGVPMHRWIRLGGTMSAARRMRVQDKIRGGGSGSTCCGCRRQTR